MKYWLATGTHTNSDVAINKNIWGMPKRFFTSSEKVNIGDVLIIFAQRQYTDDSVKPAAITSIFEIVSKPFIDENPIFKSHSNYYTEVYPIRIKLKPIHIFEKPVAFTSIIPHLNFISNKKYWTCHIRGHAIREIPKNDYQTIIDMNLQK